MFTTDELDRLTLTQLKELAHGLEITVTQVTPTRTKLQQQIRECLADNNQLIVDDVETDQILSENDTENVRVDEDNDQTLQLN